MLLQPLRPHTGAILNTRSPLGQRRFVARCLFCTLAGGPLLVIACRDTYSGFGAGAHARASADQLFGALAERHLDVVRSVKYDHARVQIARGSLSPSRVFDDSLTWTGASGAVRLLETFGTLSDGKYSMTSRPNSPAPVKPADGRHVTTLSRLSDSEYRWDTAVDFNIGTVRPNEVALLVTRLLSAGDGRGDRDARIMLNAGAPRTAAALGMLFVLDSLHPVTLADGSTAVTLGIAVRADGLKPKYPAFAQYVERYVEPARFRLALTDRGGAPFLDSYYKDRYLTIRLRTQAGHLVPLTGPARPLPDTLQLQSDFTLKVKMWNIGFHDLSMEFVNTARSETERDWAVTARKEPRWNLPFISARLIRAPLRRPFAGEGALFRIGVRSGDQSTVLFRQARLTVQESAVLRFINSLTSTAMDDFGEHVELEENRWLRELFLGLRDDGHAALPP